LSIEEPGVCALRLYAIFLNYMYTWTICMHAIDMH
jgi:hypothetical protein